MNLLYLNGDNYGGGSSIALINYVREMKNHGHKVCVLTQDNDGYIIDELRQSGVLVIICKFSFCYYPNNKNPYKWIKNFLRLLIYSIKVEKIIDNVIRKEKIDLVHTNIGPLLYALYPCKKNHIPHVWHHREYFDKIADGIKIFPSKHVFYKKINSHGNYNICITQGILNYLGLKEGIRNTVIYDGLIGVNDMKITPIGTKEKCILFVGKICENKAPDLLIRAFAAFHKKHPDYILKIAGKYDIHDSYYQDCIELVKRLNLDYYVEFLGYLKNVKRMMQSASAIVVPTIFEGFGFVVVEGMLCHTIVIGNNTTGIKEQFDLGLKQTGGEIGYRFSNEKELIDALNYVVENDMTDMQIRAYNVVCDNYTIEKCIDETERYYRNVIEDYKKCEYER